jgi:hypothetical protein
MSSLVALPWRPAPHVEPVAPAETGIPIPQRPAYRGEAKHLRLFVDLKPGQSRPFAWPMRLLVYDSSRKWGRKHGTRYSVRRDPRDPERARIWRIE